MYDDFYAVITDKNTGKVATQGCVKWAKVYHGNEDIHERSLISTDNKYFFHRSGTDKYSVEILGKKEIDFKQFSPKDFKEYVSEPWITDSKITTNIDYYIEHSEKELDPEIKPLVELLNKIPGVETTGSCCGHNKSKPWVALKTNTYMGIKFLLDTLNDQEYKVFTKWGIDLGSPSAYVSHNDYKGEIVLRIEGKHIGYNDIKYLCCILSDLL